MRQYLTQARQECAARLVTKVYGEDGKPSKWWMSFQVRIQVLSAMLIADKVCYNT